MSEVYLNRVFPAMRSAHPTEWVAVIDRALEIDVDRFVPGHGFIEEPKASREELIEYQKAMRARDRRSEAAAQAWPVRRRCGEAGELGPYKEWFLVEQQGPIAVRKIYEEIEGKLK